eukprot:170216_1
MKIIQGLLGEVFGTCINEIQDTRRIFRAKLFRAVHIFSNDILTIFPLLRADPPKSGCEEQAKTNDKENFENYFNDTFGERTDEADNKREQDNRDRLLQELLQVRSLLIDSSRR